MASKHRMTMLAILLAGMGSSVAAFAGLGPIHVLSSEGQAFEAEIPVLDEDPQGSIAVSLADRNKYPLLSTYSPSVSALNFTLIRKLDGSVQKILVRGPSHFDESLLRFAVELDWPAGRLVREFEVDYLRDGPQRKDKQPNHDETVKKNVVSPDQLPKLSHLGLGELKVKSRLGEPLEAELELLGAAATQTRDIRVALSPDALQGQQSVEQLQLIGTISHQLQATPDGKQVLHLRSQQALNDPALVFRLDVRAANIHVQKRYVLLLDPSGYTVEEHELGATAAKSVPADQTGSSALKVYRVLHGDTLSSIASRMRGGGSAAETAGRLFRANPGAFVAGDANRLRAGAALKYPANWKINAASDGAGEKSAAPVPPVAAPSPKPMQKLQPEPASAPQAAVVKPADNNAKAAISAQENKLKDTLQKQDQALQQAAQRAQELEDKIRQLQMAKAAASQPQAATPVVAQASQPLAQPRAAIAAASAATASAASVTLPSSLPAPHAVASRPLAASPKAAPPVKPAQPAPSMVDEVLDAVHNNSDTLMYGGAAAAVLALGSAALIAQRRRKKPEPAKPATPSPFADNASMLTMGPLTTLMSSAKRGEGIDLGAVDLIAEAEVYLAYGRIDQALDILREGLVREPMRQDLRYKLLEVLAMQPDKDGFIAEATVARGIFGKDSTLWMRACDLGRVLAPEHPLFVTADTGVHEVLPNQPAAAVEMPATNGLDLARELQAIEEEPEQPLAMDFMQAKPAGPAALPPAADSNHGLTGLDAFASLDEQALQDAAKLAPEPMLDMDSLADLPSLTAPDKAPAKSSASKEQDEARDKMELAKLYLEMGDKETAEALMKEAGQVS